MGTHVPRLSCATYRAADECTEQEMFHQRPTDAKDPEKKEALALSPRLALEG